ncbi:hypothetical protein GCM10023188_18800 [Pontibacter saemangeumensis]|uniref:Uncharacterized protein n=1 Tax=Pontibacter saemangeumensis TaxID=1084525 RepID=A0ABP8LLU4_9BACT
MRTHSLWRWLPARTRRRRTSFGLVVLLLTAAALTAAGRLSNSRPQGCVHQPVPERLSLYTDGPWRWEAVTGLPTPPHLLTGTNPARARNDGRGAARLQRPAPVPREDLDYNSMGYRLLGEIVNRVAWVLYSDYIGRTDGYRQQECCLGEALARREP